MNLASFEHTKFLHLLDKYKVDYLLVSDSPGQDKNASLWVNPTERNKTKLIKAINVLGYEGDVLQKVPFPQYITTNNITLPLKEKIEITGKLSNEYKFTKAKDLLQITPGRNNYPLRTISRPSLLSINDMVKKPEISLDKSITKAKTESQGKHR